MRPYTVYTKGQRRDRRIRNHGVVIDLLGQTFPVIDWSLGGIAIDRCDTTVEIGTAVDATLRRDGEPALFPVHLTITRVDPGKQVMAATYRNLSSEAFHFLEKLQINRHR
jgi:hypothetical protein